MTELLQAALAKRVSFRFRAKGFSMSPFIKNDDVITISPLNKSSIIFGKSVAFIQPEKKKLTIHRVIGRNKNSCFTKGDNAFEIDGLVPLKNILGTVSKIERRHRKVFIGLGLSRFVIAFLSRMKILFFILCIWRIIRKSLQIFLS